MVKIKRFEIWGAVLTIILGSLLHFVFAWSGNWHPLALMAAVNESTWEHLKLAFWPTFLFATVEWIIWGRGERNFCFATLVKLISIPVIIIVLFYGWLAFFPDNFIWDISIFVVAVIAGYFLGYKILTSKKQFNLETVSIILIIVALLKFSLLTYFPVKSFLTHDPIIGDYGIVDK